MEQSSNPNMGNIYDMIIVGTGFAGYTAGIYASRYKMKNVIFGDVFGGQTAEAHIIGNYPGFEEITGPELMNKVRAQTLKLGTEEIMERVTAVTPTERGDVLKVSTNSGKEYFTHYVLLTIGMKRRKLGVLGEEDFKGKGVTYCATCDGFFFKNKRVAIVGGGDAATTSALYMSTIASEVHLIVRKDRLKGETVWIDQVLANPKIKVHFNTTINEIAGTTKVERIKTTGDVPEIELDGVFVEVGSEPDTAFINELGIKTNEKGFITVDHTQATNMPRIYAAGDITANSNNFEQLVTAAGEAAVATNAIFERLQGERPVN